MITKKQPLYIDDIKKSQTILDRNASKTCGEIHLKLENMQLTGSFKFRGAFNKISQLTDQKKEREFILRSAGNHAQGIALSKHLLGIKSKIFMPISAPQTKFEATKGYRSEVISHV